jgi:hypothetical protein
MTVRDFSQPQPLFQALLDSEIDFSVTAVQHQGFALTVGDKDHGPYGAGLVTASEDIGPWLDEKARELFPASDYALAVAVK